ncbi:YdbH family protein [Providencia alcalifaciens]|uniref:YdbH family protein n=1 Tax=Providencia alcalifaciens TaxID=126385 RepID=UPI0012B6399D|nr:YdbH family protein [Providencia alcalifaciens]MTC38322.1 YdbH family protein [Providencia alcalifaciens]
MKRAIKILLLFLGAMVVLLMILWSTLTRWAPVVANHFLPSPVTLSLSAPHIVDRQIRFSHAELTATDCSLVTLTNIYISIFPIRIKADGLDINAECLNQVKTSEEPSSPPVNMTDILDAIPQFSLVIDKINLRSWEQYQGSLWLRSTPDFPLMLDYQSENLRVSSLVNQQNQLIINQFSATLPQSPLMLEQLQAPDVLKQKEEPQHIELTAQLTLPLTSDQLPEAGDIDAQFKLLELNKLLQTKLHWQQDQGLLTVMDVEQQQELFHLPWHVSSSQVIVTDGQWRWNDADIPLHGGIAFQIDNWNQTWSEFVVSGRLNMLTDAKKGKANLVLTVEPSRINLLDGDINFRLNGQVKYDDMVLDINLPAKIAGQLISPTVAFMPGSLMRAYGRLSPTILLREIRFPLAGTRLNADGITGRLQAILKVKEQYWGDFDIHLDGSANKFNIDQGKWFWNYWGNAQLPALSAHWDVKGNGSWQDTQLTLNSLNTGFDQIKYGLLSMSAPRLKLTSPLVWQRDPAKANFYGGLQLTSNRMLFGSESYLPKITANAELKGTSPASFQLKGDLSTRQVGPIVIFGRWDGERLRGEARWPEQSVKAFQTLIPKDLGIELREGKLFSQAAFSMTPENGFIAGGHWRVQNTSLWMKDGELNGLDFVLPWKLHNSTWTLGEKSPVELRIKHISNLFEFTNVKADLSGTYPPTETNPIQLSNVGFNMLGGEISLDILRWPQNKPATISVHEVELSELFTKLKVSQFAVSGRVNGELPFYLDNPEWIIKAGWMENSGPLTLRLDTNFVESIAADNISAGSAIGWLQYLEIQRSRTDVNVTSLGLLTMSTILEGYNTKEAKKREVHLNYQHEENIFQLWRSLRFGSGLEEWLEKNL